MKRPDSEVLDVSRWPSIDINALEEKARHGYQQRAMAIEYYAAGIPIGEIEDRTRLNRRVLYRMIERALQAHPDGRPWGLPAIWKSRGAVSHGSWDTGTSRLLAVIAKRLARYQVLYQGPKPKPIAPALQEREHLITDTGLVMRLRRGVMLCLALVAAMPASAQDNSYRIFETFTGHFHCGGQSRDFQLKILPVTGPLGMVDDDAGVTAAITFYFYRSVTSLDGATYTLAGPYDAKTGRFHLEPKGWYGPHPASLEMIGIEGTFDAETRKMTAKMLSDACDAVEVVGPGGKLPPLPSQPPPAAAADPARPERRMTPSDVTNYLDVAAYNPDFEYWVTAWSDPPGTVHDGEPIDEAIARMKKEKFACDGSQRVSWDARGTKGTASDRVGVTERYMIECVGDCKGVFYRPLVGARVVHFGLSVPLPMMQITSVSFGGTSFRWNLSRNKNTQPSPEIYVHRWTPLTGMGPFDPVPAEVERRIASAPPCRAPNAIKK